MKKQSFLDYIENLKVPEVSFKIDYKKQYYKERAAKYGFLPKSTSQ